MVLAAAGSMGMPPNHDSCTPAASSSHSDLQHAPAVSGDSAPDPLPWLVIESDQEPTNDEQCDGARTTVQERGPKQPLPPAEPIAVSAEPGVRLDHSLQTHQADQRQEGSTSKGALPQDQQAWQFYDDHAEQPVQHAVVYGPMPEGIEGPRHLQQATAAEQPEWQQAQNYSYMAAAPAAAQQYPQAGYPMHTWAQPPAHAPQGPAPHPSYPSAGTGAYPGAAYGVEPWQTSYAQWSSYGVPAHAPVSAWGFAQPPPQQVVPFVAMVNQYGQPYLPAYPMVMPGPQHQVMQPQPPPPAAPPPPMPTNGGRQNGHAWPSRSSLPAGGPPRSRSHGAVSGRARMQRQHGAMWQHMMYGGGGPPGNGRVMPECININRRITACNTPEELLNIITQDLEKFDSVCMATSIHTLANLRCTKAQYQAVFDSPEMLRLMAAVSEKRTDFTARNLANFLWGLAKIEHHPGEQMLTDLAMEISRKIDGANAQNLANIAWAYAVLLHSPGPELLEAIAREAEKKLAEFTSQNISNLVYAFAKLEHVPAGFLERASQAARTLLGQFTPQALSNTVWAFSKLEVLDEELFGAIAKEATGKLPRFNAQNIANTAWGFANILFEPGEEFWQLVGQNAIWHIHDYSAQNIANVLWSYAKLDHKHEALFAAAAEHAIRTIQAFQPQSMANLVWAYATLGEKPDVRCLDALASFACSNLKEFSPQNISNSAWAMATLQYKNMQFLTAVADEVTSRLAGSAASSFSRQHLANLIWAYATLEVEPKQALLKAIAQAMAERAAQCNPQEISNCVWAFARLRFYDQRVMDVFAGEAQGRIEEFSQQNLANVAWAVGKLSHFHQGLLDAMAKHAVSMVKDLSLQHISNILWAYVSFLQMREPMTSAFLEELQLRLRKATFNAQQLSNLLWSLCIAELCTEGIWQGTMEQIPKLSIQPAELPEEALTQIYQAHLLMMVDKPGADLRMPSGLMEAAHRTWLASARHVRVSALHREVSRLLGDRGVAHTIEHLTDDQLFSVDIALAGERIAFEVDGPHHFTANTLAVTGEMLARQKLLRARGWHIISVPFFRWAGRSDEARAMWLLQELHIARESQARAYGLSWTAAAPPLAQPVLAGQQEPQAPHSAWAMHPGPPHSRPEVRAHVTLPMPGPAPPRHPPPGSLPAPAHRPHVALPHSDAAVTPAPTPAAVLPPPSAAVLVSTSAPALGESGPVNAGSKRPPSSEAAQGPAAKRAHAASAITPDTSGHLVASHVLSHADAETSQGMTSTGSPVGLACADLSESAGDLTIWQAPLHGSAGSVTQGSAHDQAAQK